MNKLLRIGSLMILASPLLAQPNNNGEIWEPVPGLVTGVENGSVPSDAIVLFDGSNMDAWVNAISGDAAQWDVTDGVMTVKTGAGTIKTRQAFGSIQLHVEWRATDVIRGESQGRGNSGIFLQSLFEVQILDSWDNPTYVNGQAGSVYKQTAPLVNASREPGEWQSYDIVYTAPTYSAQGELQSPAYVTALHNGVLILNNVEILGATFTPTPEYGVRCKPYPYPQLEETDCSGKMPLTLQDHGQIVSYRNIWVREL